MRSPARCLICYCHTKVNPFSAEERAPPPPPRIEVQTCHDDGATENFQSEDKEGPELPHCLSSPPENKLCKDLRAIFILDKLLKVPQEELASHLSKWGSPGSWICLCSSCNKAVANAQRINQQVLDATRILEGMKGDIVGMIKESLKSEPLPSSQEVPGIFEVTVKTREFVRGCEYVQQTISDPFISGDLKAYELLKLQEQERFSNSSGNDEDNGLMEVDEEDDAEQSVQSSIILDSSNEASDDVQTLFMTPPPSIQSTPPKLSDCEAQDNNEEIYAALALKTEEPADIENQKMELSTISPPPDIKPDPKPTNTIQLSFNIPKLPVIKKEPVPAPVKVEAPWMIEVRPNIFTKKSEEPTKQTAISKSLESSVPPEKLDGAIVPIVNVPRDNAEAVIKSEVQTRDVEIKPEVQTQTPDIVQQTIKLEPPENLEAFIKPKALVLGNAEFAIKQEVHTPNPMEKAIKPEAQSPENRKEVIKPKTLAPTPANCFTQLPAKSKSKAVPSPPPRPDSTTSSPSISTVDAMLADLDPFVQELISVPAPKLSKAKASTSVSTSSSPSSSVKQSFQQAKIGQSRNNSGQHGFDRQILQNNGQWRRYCRCGVSYINSSDLSRHITNMTPVVVPRNANSGPPQKFQCFICKFASPSVLAIFNNLNLLKTHLDQVHHTKIIPGSRTATQTQPNGGGGSIQILNNDGSFKDQTMELRRQLSFIPIQRLAEAESSSPTPPKNTAIRPSQAPMLQQQPVEQRNFTSKSPITITTTAVKSSRSVQATTSTPKNIVVRPSPGPKLQRQLVQPNNGTSNSPITITTTALKPRRSVLSKPPTPTKRQFKPRWYVCRQCLGSNPPQTKRFTCLAHLTNHIHSEHGGWLCPTPNCEKIFSTWMHLIAHRRKEQCCSKNGQILKPCLAQSQVQVLKTSPITVPTFASRPKNTLERYLQVATVERKPIIKPRILDVEIDDDVICIDD